MTTLYIGSGQNRISAASALAQARPGDVLSFAQGSYDLGAVTLSGLTLTGEGAPETTTLIAEITPQGSCAINFLTLNAKPRGSAITMIAGVSTHLTISDCRIAGDATASTMTVAIDGGTVVLNRVVIADDADLATVQVKMGARLHATNARLGGLEVRGGTADLIGCAAHLVLASDGAKIHAYKALELAPVPGKRALRALSGALLELESVTLSGDQVFEAQVSDAKLQIARLESPSDQALRVLTEGEAHVVCDSPLVEIAQAIPITRKATSRRRGSGPQRVLWPAAHGHAFATEVQPGLQPGDTLVLEEGEYSFDDLAYGELFCEVNIDGEGRRDRILLRGRLTVPPNAHVTLTNFTIEHPVSTNAIFVEADGDLSMHGVDVRSHPATEFPAVYVEGKVTATACELKAGPAETTATIRLVGEATLSALVCDLGWTNFGGKSVTSLENCHLIRLGVLDEARVTSAGMLVVLPNTRNQCVITAKGQASIDIDVLDCPPGEEVNISEQSTLSITSYAGGRAPQITREGYAQMLQGAATGYREGAKGGMVTSLLPDQPGSKVKHTAAGDDGSNVTGVREDSLAALNHLIGLRTVKEQAAQFVKNAVINRERESLGLKSMPLTLHSLFLGNPGTGKTTVARLLGQALYAEGVVNSDVFVEVGRADLIGVHVGETAPKTEKVLESARGGILFIDEAYSLANWAEEDFGVEAVDTIISYMDNHRDDLMIIFAGYTDKMQRLLDLNAGLESRAPNRFDFEDFTGDELATIGVKALRDTDYELEDEDLYRRILSRGYTQSADRSNARWVRNFNQDLIGHQVDRVHEIRTRTVADYRLIADEDLYAAAGVDVDAEGGSPAVARLLAELDSLIGLAEVKTWVGKLVNRVKADQRRIQIDANISRPTYHVTFTGSPGTGKTTVARIVAELFHELGVLSKPTVKEVNRSALVGAYLGQSEARTTRAVDEAMGGVLFIDEAYDLYRGGSGSSNDYGQAVIATLLPRLENDRDKFVAILAGYEAEMQTFFDVNPGLRSRVPHTVRFADYSPEDVAAIAVSILAKSWTFDETRLAEIVAAVYRALAQKDQANGRTARILAEELEGLQADHIATNNVSDTQLNVIPSSVLDAFARARGVA